MLEAKYFLTDGKGYKGRQASVLKPGKYRLNTELYRIKMVPQTEVKPGEVGVLKSNYGQPPSVTRKVATEVDSKLEEIRFASEGEMGIRAEVLPPGKYALNSDALAVTEMWTTQMIAKYTADAPGNPGRARVVVTGAEGTHLAPPAPSRSRRRQSVPSVLEGEFGRSLEK
jgi:hypothetical protein